MCAHLLPRVFLLVLKTIVAEEYITMAACGGVGYQV